MMPRLITVGLVLAAAGLAAGCSNSDSSSKSSTEGRTGPPPQPPTTLAADSFGEAVTVTEGRATHDGDVTIDRATGRVYVSWAQDSPKKGKRVPQDAYVAYSDDGGKTFSDPVRANHDKGLVSVGYNSQTRIVSTGEDRLFAAWPIDDDGAYNVVGALSTDGATTFAPEKRLTLADGKEAQDGYEAVATYGKNVYVGYLNWSETGPDGGIRMVRSSDGGKTFGKSTLAEASSCGCCDNAMAVDSKGTVFFAYRNVDAVTKNTQVRDSAVVRSFDNGATWSDLVKMGDDDWEFNGCPEGNPELAVDDEDNVHGVYWTGKPGRPGIYYTWSDDSGASFADPIAVAIDDFYPPAYTDIAVEDDGTAWMVWDDRRKKDRQVHLARAKDRKVEILKQPFGAGITPAIDSDGSMVAMSWSDDKGVHVAVRGEAAKDGYGSGPGDAKSGQEKKKGHGH